jgi:hypothetical protein
MFSVGDDDLSQPATDVVNRTSVLGQALWLIRRGEVASRRRV